MAPDLAAPGLAELAHSLEDLGYGTPGLTPLGHDGVAHSHYRISESGGDTGLLLRVPRFSQWDRDAADHLAYQAAGFTRAHPSGHTPRLDAVLPISEAAPMGALIVEEIAGSPPDLTGAPEQHMAAIAEALRALHACPVASPEAAAPLAYHADPHAGPVAATLAVIKSQAVHIAQAGLTPAARAAIEEELAWAEEFAANAGRGSGPITPCPITLCGTDTHPGNFLIDANGKAWFVDAEKIVYGSPAIDLAHASLPTSTGWEPRCAAKLAPETVAGFYRRYLDGLTPEMVVDLEPWLAPMRRLTWLRTITWFARWRADWSQTKNTAPQDPDLARHIEAHIAASFDEAEIAAMRANWAVVPANAPANAVAPANMVDLRQNDGYNLDE